MRVDTHHGQLAIAGKDTLLVLSARLPGGPVEVGTFEYAAEAVTWAADGNGLVAAPRGGGLDYLSFVPSVDNQLSTVSLGFTGVALQHAVGAVLVVARRPPSGHRGRDPCRRRGLHPQTHLVAVLVRSLAQALGSLRPGSCVIRCVSTCRE